MDDESVAFVLFDLGGVLIELGGMSWFQELSGSATEEVMWERWLTCPWVRRFETGECSPEAFAEGIVSEWRLAIPPGQFLEHFASWPVGPFPGAVRLLTDVQASVPVGCCSNTNVLHWSLQAREWPWLKQFDHSFLSFELGLVKPDRDMFEAVVEGVAVSPRRILFLDDVAVNIQAAQEFGFQARQVRGPRECRAVLGELSLLDAASPAT